MGHWVFLGVRQANRSKTAMGVFALAPRPRSSFLGLDDDLFLFDFRKVAVCWGPRFP